MFRRVVVGQRGVADVGKVWGSMSREVKAVDVERGLCVVEMEAADGEFLESQVGSGLD